MLCYNGIAMMKLQYRIRDFCCALILVVLGLFLAFSHFSRPHSAYAEDEITDGESHFVTIHDDESDLTVKTAAPTVRTVLERAEIQITENDIVDPGLDTTIDGDNYHINIYRARPAVVIDGTKRRYVMTASFDPYTVAREAGFTVYDGDEINLVTNDNFLEAGAVSTFRIERNGGRTITIEESLPYTTETRYDYNLAKGERQVERPGEDGRKISHYEIQFENNVEVSRTLISEEITLEPISEIVVVGAKLSVAPGQETCLGWLREVGVGEEDLEAALYIIYHESGCRVDAENVRSGAYGIPQALPGSKMASAGDDWRTNPLTQLRWMNGYVNGRYDGWQGALQHKLSKGWY